MSDNAPRSMTLDEFLAWQVRQDMRFEFVDGRPVAMTGGKLRHDRVTANAIRTIGNEFRRVGNPCDVFTADVGIRTAPRRMRRPDASVLCPPFEEDAMISDRPRLVLEVLSESTEQMDRFVKLGDYEALDSLDYIVMADPTRVEVGLWYRDARRAWRSELILDREATLELPALGIAVKMMDLYDRATLVSGSPGPRLVWDNEPEDGI